MRPSPRTSCGCAARTPPRCPGHPELRRRRRACEASGLQILGRAGCAGRINPIGRHSRPYVNRTALARPEVQKFVEYYITHSTELIQEVGYVPMSDPEQQLVRDRFAAKTVGTMYSPTSTLSAHASLEERLKAK